MAVKYQIFISSTYDDLKKEREAVIKATLEMGHIPVGMEMFSAADEEQWKIITRTIDDCDYYIVLVAHRYGSIVPETGISYTEKEYEYARSKEIPILGFVLDEEVDWPPQNIDEGENKRKLQEFKTKVRGKPISFWKSVDHLKGEYVIALSKSFNTTPRKGWIQATSLNNAEIINEISRLSKENDDYRKQVNEMQTNVDAILVAKRLNLLEQLKKHVCQISVHLKGKTGWVNKEDTNLKDVFSKIAGQMIPYSDMKYLGLTIAVNFADVSDLDHVNWAVPSNFLNEWLSKLTVFGLVKSLPDNIIDKQIDKFSIKWALTEEGIEVLKLIYEGK